MTDLNLFNLALSKLMLTSVLLGDDMDQGLSERGLTRVRATALWEIAESGPVTQRHLADRLKVTPRNVTTLVDALETAGFVERTSHPTDRRATLLALTDKGTAATARMRMEKAAMAEALFSSVPKAKLQCFVDVLDEIVERVNLEREAQGKSPGKP